LQDRIAALIQTHRTTRCNGAVADLMGIVMHEDGGGADEAHRYLCVEYGLVRDGAAGVRALVLVG